MKKLLLSAILSVLALTGSASPSVLQVRDTITDNNIIFPASFDTDIKELMTNWYLQRYAVLDSLSQRPVQAQVSDREYIDRLQKLPTVIEMPYNSIVRQYIEMYAFRRQELVEKMLSLGLYYNPIFEDALERYGLPQELKYLPIIESALNPNAVSKAGAAGLWQFMPSTATGEGLEVNSLIDERRDPFKSSDAAAAFLKKLYGIYGDWSLVLAAYNCGPGNVNKAIKNAGDKRDFWEIYSFLPKETRGYVPAFIAATYIMHNFGHHGISPAVARSPIVTDTVHVCNRVHFNQISEVMGISVDELRILNPQYRQDVIPGNIKPYALILPSVQAYCYKANEDSILNYDRKTYEQRAIVDPNTGRSLTASEYVLGNGSITGSDAKGQYIDELTVKTHTVQRGETLKSIAKKYNVTPESIQQTNNLSSTKLKRGKKLTINIYKRTYVENAPDTVKTQEIAVNTPTPSPQPVNTTVAPSKSNPAPKQSAPVSKPKAQATSHKVKSGETLSSIASKHGVTVAQLKSANGLKSDGIQAGQTLKIPAKSAPAKSTSKKKSSKKKSSKKK